METIKKLDFKWRMRIALAFLVTLISIEVYADENDGTIETVTLPQAGELQSVLLDLESSQIKSLTIKGSMNASDISFLRSGVGKISKLEELNLADVSLVLSNEPYITIISPVPGTFQKICDKYYISENNYVEDKGVDGISQNSTRTYEHYTNQLDYLFYDAAIGQSLKKVAMPSNLSVIGEAAFKNSKVEVVVMQSPIKKIAEKAFESSSIKQVVGEWSQLQSIGESAFYCATEFEGNKENNTLDISALDSIPTYAFLGCAIKKVILSPNTWYIGRGALCFDMLEETNVPSTLIRLWSTSFSSDSPFFKDLPTEGNITYLGKFALCVKERITTPTVLSFKEGTECIVDRFGFPQNQEEEYITDLRFPSTLKFIGDEAFSLLGLNNIKSLTFPEGLEEIGEGCFGAYTYTGCPNLASVTFPSSLKKIGRSAFERCALQKVVIPESVEMIGQSAFAENKSLQLVEYNAQNVAYEPYNSMFWNCTWLSKVTIGPRVETIPSYFCRGCSNLKTIEFKNRDSYAGNLTIYECAFEQSKINTLILPEGCSSIGTMAFSSCTNLTTLVLPNSLENLGYHAFNRCSGLTEVIIPKNVTNVEYSNKEYLGKSGPFAECTNLKSLTINSKETFKWEGQSLSSLKEVILGENVELLSEHAFYGVTGIEDIYCYATKIPEVGKVPFIKSNVKNTILHVPASQRSSYQEKEGWNSIANIVEMPNGESLGQITSETNMNANTLEGKDLTDNVVDNIYYNLNGEGSGYDSNDQSITIGVATDMSQIENMEPGSYDISRKFSGVILKVVAGTGTITVSAKTVGNAQIAVQIGNSSPQTATRTEKGDIVVSYDVAETSFVYIYALSGSNNAVSRRSNSDILIKIYAIAVNPVPTSIKELESSTLKEGNYYTISGCRIEGRPTKKGLYIVNGRKTVIR